MAIKQGQQAIASDFISEFVAGEDLAANDAVSLAEAAEDVLSATVISQPSSDGVLGLPTSSWNAQSFTVPAGVSKLSSITAPPLHVGNSGGTYRIKVRATLTGADLYSGDFSPPYSGDFTQVFYPNIAVTPGATLYVLFINAGSLSSPTISKKSGTPTIGSAYYSSDSGANWSGQNPQFDWTITLTFIERALVAGRVYKSKALYNDQRVNFKGFVMSAVSAGNRVQIATHRIYSGLSGLTPDSAYYLSATSGAISTTPGTIQRWIGIAKNATTLDRLLGIKRVVSKPQSLRAGGSVIPHDGYVVRAAGDDGDISIAGVTIRNGGLASAGSTYGGVATITFIQ